jgi:thiosulfate reductase cytochrome b subunit
LQKQTAQKNAQLAEFKWLMYTGIILLAVSMLITGIGLLKNLQPSNV